MENSSNLIRRMQQRRFLLVLPVLVLPFVIGLFWALGGGSGISQPAQPPQGLNQTLPDPQLPESTAASKLEYYRKAGADSVRVRDMHRKAPLLRSLLAADSFLTRHVPALSAAGEGAGRTVFGDGETEHPAAQEARLQEKLLQLQVLLDGSPGLQGPAPTGRGSSAAPSPGIRPTAPARMGVASVPEQNREPDPEVEQLNGMLDKILDIQHPHRVRERETTTAGQATGEVLGIRAKREGAPVSLLTAPGAENGQEAAPGSETGGVMASGFHSWSAGEETRAGPGAIQAVVPETQTLANGATIRLRLDQDAVIKDMLLPGGSLLFGKVSLEGERLRIRVQSIRLGAQLLPVSLTAFDLDGLEGLYIPGSITQEVAQQTAGQLLQEVGMSGRLSPTLELQAAGFGMDMARGLFRKKTRQAKATVKAGYRVLLVEHRQG